MNYYVIAGVLALVVWDWFRNRKVDKLNSQLAVLEVEEQINKDLLVNQQEEINTLKAQLAAEKVFRQQDIDTFNAAFAEKDKKMLETVARKNEILKELNELKADNNFVNKAKSGYMDMLEEALKQHSMLEQENKKLRQELLVQPNAETKFIYKTVQAPKMEYTKEFQKNLDLVTALSGAELKKLVSKIKPTTKKRKPVKVGARLKKGKK